MSGRSIIGEFRPFFSSLKPMSLRRQRTVYACNKGSSGLAWNSAVILWTVGISFQQKKRCTHNLAHTTQSPCLVSQRLLPTLAGRFREGVASCPSIASTALSLLISWTISTPTASSLHLADLVNGEAGLREPQLNVSVYNQLSFTAVEDTAALMFLVEVPPLRR